jgi:hypothetical protein
MTTFPFRRPKLTWKRLILATLGAGAVTGAIWLGRSATQPQADAAPPTQPTTEAPTPAPPPPTATEDPSYYSQRVVAFAYGNTLPITHEQLGEYLIARCGPDKVLNLVSKLVIEQKCRDCGIDVTEVEINLALEDDLAGNQINRREFVERLLRQRHKSLYEWREDVLRPKLMMTKLLRDKAVATDEDVRKAFESAHGERLVCQAIMWPKGIDTEKKMREEYDDLIHDPIKFTQFARTKNCKALEAVGGMLDTVSHHSLDDQALEAVLFTMKEGEVTQVLPITMGGENYCGIVKVLKKLPPNPTKKLENERTALEKEIIEAKIDHFIPAEMDTLLKAANPKIVLKPNLEDDDWRRREPPIRGKDDKVQEKLFHYVDMAPLPGVPNSQQPVAYIYDTIPVTRQQLGEYLIKRYGAECVDLMVNKIIIEKECEKQGFTVTEAEIEDALKQDIQTSGAADKVRFIKEYLWANRTTLYGYREDVLKPKLLLSKLVSRNVKVEEKDLQEAMEAYHGEKADCQIIMWPRTPRDHEIAIKQYDLIRRSEKAFDDAARSQASPRLAAIAGHISPPFARHTTGNEDLEREVFRLVEGGITPVIETPEGYIVARLLHRIAAIPVPTDPIAAAEERARWEAEILKKKTQVQIPTEVAKLRAAAEPNVILRPMIHEDEWMREIKQEIGGTSAGTNGTVKN